jgi:hypothetical protein
MPRRATPKTTTTAPASAGQVIDLQIHLPDPRPHIHQMACLASRALRKIMRAGRRGGKTVTSAMEAVAEFLGFQFAPDGSMTQIKEGGRVLYVSPTSNQVDRFWYEVKQALREPIEAGLYYLNETKHIIERPGTLFRIRAMTGWSPDHLRGDTADLIIFDEYQLMDEAIWAEVGAPMLMDTRGRALFIYTPPSLHSTARSKARDPRHAAKLFKKAQQDGSGLWEVFHFSSKENPYLPPGAVEEVAQDMTALAYQQEIEALDVDEAPGALWTHALIEATRVDFAPDLDYIVVAVDPPGSVAECGIVISAAAHGHFYVVADDSLAGKPGDWALQVVTSFARKSANLVIAEKNFGGEMVEHTLRTVRGGRDLPILVITAHRGKALRAEPVVALYQRGLVHHVGLFPYLEEQMALWEPLSGQKSPDRLDALVHGLTYLSRMSRTSVRRIPVQGLYASQHLRYTKDQRSRRVRGHETPQE